VVDSAFSSLDTLARELVDLARNEGYTIPSFVVSGAMGMIKSSVQNKADFSIDDLTPIAHADTCFIPALFAHPHDDRFIQPHHSDDIHAKYAGDKNIIKVDGDHNTPRPQFFQDSAGIFLTQALQVPPALMLDPQTIHMNRYPWHQMDGYSHRFYSARPTVLSPVGSMDGLETDPDNYDEEQLQRVLSESMEGYGGGGETAKESEGEESFRIPEQPVEPEEEKVAMLVAMGFEEESAKAALIKTGNDVEAAVQVILS